MSIKKEAEDILENVQEVISGKEEVGDILDNIQPPLTLTDIEEKTAQLARTLTKNRIGFYALGMVVGGVTGYFVTKRLLRAKYIKIADAEISEMREHYQEKVRALEAKAAKRPVNEIVRERGYSPEPEHVEPPMAVQPPTIVVEAEDASSEDPEESEEPKVRNIFEEAKITHVWDWHDERRHRTPDAPYVIHVDEKYEMDYEVVTLTYYEGDNVLCNERDEIIDPDYDREKMVGEKNLLRFGHGSNDASIVYIRNDSLELVFEVCRSPHWYAEEVHGFSHHSDAYKNLERMRIRERNEQEE